MKNEHDNTPERVRIRDSYRKRIFLESQNLDKSYLETLYFIIDCYFAFKKGAFPLQLGGVHTPVPPPVTINQNQQQAQEPEPATVIPQTLEKPDDDTFTLDFDL
ncbi:hypothetical protein ACN23B_27350 (plasmid) [Anabaena sp. FACHB-709]|uniref:Uncharacterized protein n=2 Tax=Nostocaceae TaxID=1162 RepID=A0ABR8BNA3_9NOSO|nr:MULTISPECIES: hypothetical protein [Nostocaceae]MBD2174952.1 hypothetical protein [Anabaena cylindrica FACHB-318]MBD2255612.1 hypothetical protein [Nostoc parmelioides FACHB-3921]MBD2266707.1 hypothetical protein [Anabaena sp. FACHB-709]MBD2276353.1 hypothetical protein [Nostoc sp. PCC 7120 = FACHB-418]MBD2286919.1 hypothetical protein [Anabaena cylindrica FACHB-170]